MLVYDENNDVRTKALWALSCLVRNFPAGEGRFVQADGIYVLCRGVRDEDVRVRTKSLFLLTYLLTRDKALRSDDVVNVYGIKIGVSPSEFISHICFTLTCGVLSQEFGLFKDLVDMVGSQDGIDVAEGVLSLLLKLQNLPAPRAALLAVGLNEKLLSREAALSTLEGDELEDSQGELALLKAVKEALSKEIIIAEAAPQEQAAPPVKVMALEHKGDPLD